MLALQILKVTEELFHLSNGSRTQYINWNAAAFGVDNCLLTIAIIRAQRDQSIGFVRFLHHNRGHTESFSGLHESIARHAIWINLYRLHRAADRFKTLWCRNRDRLF